jgi:indole-3-glycerol phosphate synthase
VTDFLSQVVAERRADVERAKREVPESVLLERAALRGIKSVRQYGHRDGFTHALWVPQVQGRLAVIAEVKRVSPALGALKVDADVRAIAERYEAAGAHAISVLCEPRHWGGSLEDLAAVADVVGIPVLCKDVIVDEYQIVAAWAAGADAVLLIAEALDDVTLRRLIARADGLGMGVLVEAHETEAFERVVHSSAWVVGVNARDLRAPKEIRPDRIRMLHHLARSGQILVAESGIASADDARALPARVDAVLVGTALMRAEDPTVLIRQLVAVKRTGAYARTRLVIRPGVPAGPQRRH